MKILVEQTVFIYLADNRTSLKGFFNGQSACCNINYSPSTGPIQYTKVYSAKLFPGQGNCIEKASAGLNTAPVR